MNDNQWASTNNGIFPPDGSPVLIVTGDGARMIAHRHEGKWMDGTHWEFAEVTHWQPLPAPPKVDSFEQWWGASGLAWGDKAAARRAFSAGAKANQSPDYVESRSLDDDAASKLRYLTSIEPYVDRINKLVNDNPIYFDAAIGQDCLVVAVKKLEAILARYGDEVEPKLRR